MGAAAARLKINGSANFTNDPECGFNVQRHDNLDVTLNIESQNLICNNNTEVVCEACFLNETNHTSDRIGDLFCEPSKPAYLTVLMESHENILCALPISIILAIAIIAAMAIVVG